MCFLPLKSSHYLSWPVPVPKLFGKYPTRPVPKSKTPTRQTLYLVCKSRSAGATSLPPKSNCCLDLDVAPTCDKSSRCEILGEEGGDRAQQQKDTTIGWSEVN